MKKTLERLPIVFLALIALIMPMHRTYSSYPLILLAMSWLALGGFKNLWSRRRGYWVLWIGLAFYGIHLLGLPFANDMSRAGEELMRKLPFLLLPVVVYSLDRLEKRQIHLIFGAFILGCFLSSLIAYGHSLYLHFQGVKNAFYYKNLVELSYLHPSYLSLYLFTAIALIMYLLQEYGGQLSLYTWVSAGTVLLHFLLFAILLSSRAEIVFFLVTANVMVILMLLRRKRWLAALLFVVLFNGGTIAVLSQFEVTSERFRLLINKESVEYWHSTKSREIIFESALAVFGKHWLTGVGTSNGVDALSREYRARGFELGVEKGYNAHNQYLESGIALGVLGLGLLCAWLIYPFILSWRAFEPLPLFFLLLFALSLTAESMLESQMGVVYFALFQALFSFKRY